jgi:hypothetical protein
MSDEEHHMIAFWVFVFGSALAFWVIAVRWALHAFA